jgi:hypothetical protein
MIAFFADNHFGARPGFHLYEQIRDNYSVEFREDDLTDLPGLLSRNDCQMLVINWISDTGNNPHPWPGNWSRSTCLLMKSTRNWSKHAPLL